MGRAGHLSALPSPAGTCLADTRLSRFTRLEFSPRKAAGDLDFWGGVLVAVMVVMSDSDELMPPMLKTSEAPSVGEVGIADVTLC